MSGAGIIQIDANTVLSGASVVFTAPLLGLGAALQITGSSITSGLIINGWNVGDIIELNGIDFDSGGSASATVVSGGSTLDVHEGGTDYLINFGVGLSNFDFSLTGGPAGSNGGTFVEITGVTLRSGGTLSGAAIGSGVTVSVGSGGTMAATQSAAAVR